MKKVLIGCGDVRRFKPEITPIAANGISGRDEIGFEIPFGTEGTAWGDCATHGSTRG